MISTFPDQKVASSKVTYHESKNIILPNAVNHKFFLHVINTLKEKQYKILLTSRESLKNLEIDLLDLKSRLLVLPQANILLPTDDVLLGIIFKLAKEEFEIEHKLQPG